MITLESSQRIQSCLHFIIYIQQPRLIIFIPLIQVRNILSCLSGLEKRAIDWNVDGKPALLFDLLTLRIFRRALSMSPRLIVNAYFLAKINNITAQSQSSITIMTGLK